MTPTEFWALAPGEVWWIIDAHEAQSGRPTQVDYDELLTMLEEAQAKESLTK